MKKLKKRVKFKVILLFMPLITLAVRLLGRSIRWRKRYDFDKDRGVIYALWHGHALALALFGMDRGIYTMASRFTDGEIATRILKGLGFEVVRGSTEEGKAHKGGRRGAIQLMQALKKGKNVAITVDGPKGPAFRVKKGVVFLAQKTGAKIIPVAVRFERAKIFSSWDRFTLPYPFTRGEVIIGDPIYVSEGDDIEEKRSEVERALRRISGVNT